VKGQRSLTLGRLVNSGILVEASVWISSSIGMIVAIGCGFGDMVLVWPIFLCWPSGITELNCVGFERDSVPNTARSTGF
jgi:hypothetical protein